MFTSRHSRSVAKLRVHAAKSPRARRRADRGGLFVFASYRESGASCPRTKIILSRSWILTVGTNASVRRAEPPSWGRLGNRTLGTSVARMPVAARTRSCAHSACQVSTIPARCASVARELRPCGVHIRHIGSWPWRPRSVSQPSSGPSKCRPRGVWSLGSIRLAGTVRAGPRRGCSQPALITIR